jgi:hypothetical protein
MATRRAASAVAPLRDGPAQAVRAAGRLDEFKAGVLEAARRLRLKVSPISKKMKRCGERTEGSDDYVGKSAYELFLAC